MGWSDLIDALDAWGNELGRRLSLTSWLERRPPDGRVARLRESVDNPRPDRPSGRFFMWAGRLDDRLGVRRGPAPPRLPVTVVEIFEEMARRPVIWIVIVGYGLIAALAALHAEAWPAIAPLTTLIVVAAASRAGRRKYRQRISTVDGDFADGGACAEPPLRR